MTVRDAGIAARRYLPSTVFRQIRRVGTACLTPLLFSARSGHAASAMRERAVDRTGKPIPWLTYPAIDMLRSNSLSERRVLEFGAGQSTLWFAEHAKSVLSIESDREWYKYVSRDLPSNARVELLPVSLEGIESRLGDSNRFDIVLVDDFERVKPAQYAEKLVKPDGVVILDDSEGYWGAAGTYPIMDQFREAGFMRVDFYGLAPGVIQPHCTSMFFKEGCFLFAGSGVPKRYGDQ